MSSHERDLERWFTGAMSAGERAQYELRRQQEPQARARYDRLFDVLRGLDESDESLSPLEFELVEARLFAADPTPEESPAALRGAGSWLWAGALSLLTAALLVMLWPGALPESESESVQGGGIAYVPPNAPLGVGQGFVARGGKPGEGLAVEFYCGSPARPILDQRCAIDEDLSFAFQVEAINEPGGHLSLFGIDARGELMYYFPTPVDADLPQPRDDRWMAVEHSVRLDVNHEPGTVRMFALWSPTAPSTADIESFHLVLREAELDADQAWTTLLPSDSLTRICGAADSCRSARGELTISRKNHP